MGLHGGMMECLNERWNDNTNNIIPSFQRPFQHSIIPSIPIDGNPGTNA
jgi:hypothetical protein